MDFRLVSISITLNDLERPQRNILHCSFSGARCIEANEFLQNL